ncbi:MAG: UDP-3-O-[3-hydroxymyristoyl] N-acetylglucosamine deacetylase [Candidatus Saganbacteria bacterium]|nr:UDP-3-O-[3-hydroxymyristoyl] N-acetylglucosamine deacetylase [Candidatus Saganbacteria bacterium]
MNQRTIARPVSLKGIGLHSGKESEVIMAPAEAGAGITINGIPAIISNVTSTDRATTIGGVALVEHLLSAAYGLGIDNLKVAVTGPELPIGDGSALPFAQALEQAGPVEQPAERLYYELKENITVKEGEALLAARPFDGFKVEFMVKFEGFGEQTLIFDPSRQSYLKEIAPARTFGRLSEAEALKRQGLALGASLGNALVLGKDGYVNEPRFPDEPVRHKLLDLIGDLALLGRPLCAALKAERSGHKLNTELVRRLLANDRT